MQHAVCVEVLEAPQDVDRVAPHDRLAEAAVVRAQRRERPAGHPLLVDAEDALGLVELGAGHGKMGFLVLTHLVRLREFWPAPGAFRYVLTDCCAQSVQFWAAHPALQRFFKAGLCDYARFDAEKDTEIHLERAGITLKRGPTLCRPMIVLANYVFSALRQDYFQVFGGKGMPAPLLRAVIAKRRDLRARPLVRKPSLGPSSWDPGAARRPPRT